MYFRPSSQAMTISWIITQLWSCVPLDGVMSVSHCTPRSFPSSTETCEKASCSLTEKNFANQNCKKHLSLVFFRERWWRRQEGRQEEGFFFPNCISSVQGKYRRHSLWFSLSFFFFLVEEKSLTNSNMAILLHLLTFFCIKNTSSIIHKSWLRSAEASWGGHVLIQPFFECWKKYLGQAMVLFSDEYTGW